MTDDQIVSFLRGALPDRAGLLPAPMLRELVARSNDDAFLADPEGAVAGPSSGAQAGVYAIAKLVALCVAFVRHVARHLGDGEARATALELYPAFVNDQLPRHIAAALPDDIRRHLFKLYVEEQKLVSTP